ncbi:hypothetical protein FSP39_005536 [Pinctada imbricata]|uniref:Polypeptide N-acetylgalactosaminyltransferase n=1 Tax=Pinctada imbricata TaxID=66713 RepID=A0AA88Y501_PINIB|nr:hypothetical protein FSP39_005536 [Pinctada imbricata]
MRTNLSINPAIFEDVSIMQITTRIIENERGVQSNIIPMRVRYRRSAVIKLGIFIIAALFLLPFLIHQLDHSSKEDSVQELKKRWKLAKDKQKRGNVEADKNIKNVVDNPMGVKHDNKQGVAAPTHGPEQVLKPGILGNFEPKNYPNRNGPGENGKSVHTSLGEKAQAEKAKKTYGFNMVNSDKIALNRTVPDTRHEECKYWHYPEDLPTASVILVFHNEGWSTLLRTVHSVINMSPPQFLKEVVMVDDFSDKEHLKDKLETYLKKEFKGLVKLYRNKERMGLIGTRTRGAELSTGDVIIFLDAHCECNKNWLVPLLARIKYDRRIMAVPTIDGIDWDNFKYHPVYGPTHHRGIFEWGFLYKESAVPERELRTHQHHSAPYKSPTHAGGLFAMDRKYFFELGAYDEGLKIWGGENFELSFKIWQCGGSIEWVPCSRVGHVYRNHMPYGFGKIDVKIPVILLNYMRVVEVWLDEEHKEYFYTREPSVRGYPIGDVSKQLKFKKDNKCKDFKWFMDNVAYEVYDRFPRLPPNKAWGEVKEKSGSKCWDTMGQQVGGGAIGASYCHHFGGSQLFRINTKGQIGVGERCIESRNGNTLHVSFCDVQPTGPWEFDELSGRIRHTDHDKCVESGGDGQLTLQPCSSNNNQQQFVVNEVYAWKR